MFKVNLAARKEGNLESHLQHLTKLLDMVALLAGWCNGHIFIILNSFLGIPNSMRILYKTSLLTESEAFLKSIKS
jgi:hypothetical protein